MKDVGGAARRGLYSPDFEKDNCGVGFIADIKGRPSHEIVQKSILALRNMTHRGAAVGIGTDPKTGDGAGILTAVPDEFFRRNAASLGIQLPEAGRYGVGMFFLPRERILRLQCEGIAERVCREEGLQTLGWRDVPLDIRSIGTAARESKPNIRQLFVAARGEQGAALERRLYMARKCLEKELQRLLPQAVDAFYICSFSSRTIVYKGLLLAEQMPLFFADLRDYAFKTHLAIFHQRYSTNTFPTWRLAHPFRMLSHNGEINTIKGNRNWMHAREGFVRSQIIGESLEKVTPFLDANASDSASLDNVLELLVMDGRSVAHSMMMLVPEAWQNNTALEQYKRDFYEYHGYLVEPWDGPAALTFTDGIQIGATLDRNGLRPARYCITVDGLVVLASEAGVAHIPESSIAQKGKLRPGSMLLVDTQRQIVLDDIAIKKEVCRNQDYRSLTRQCKVELDHSRDYQRIVKVDPAGLTEKQLMFGYSLEDINRIIGSMAVNGKEPIGSMGNDTPLAVLSLKPQLLFNYFKQIFAQVTNPPIDPIREKLVMSLMNYAGTQENILNQGRLENRYIEIPKPILTDNEFDQIKAMDNDYFRCISFSISFPVLAGVEGFRGAIQLLCQRVLEKAQDGYNLIVLTDRSAGSSEVAIPALLAVSAVHHYLVEAKYRTKVSIFIETGEARESNHFALLLAYGVTAINPYLAFQTIGHLVDDGLIPALSYEQAIDHYLKAICDGLLKILSKVGISSLPSYQAAQLYEVVGLDHDFIQKYFGSTPSRIGGAKLDHLFDDLLRFHQQAYSQNHVLKMCPPGGIYSYRKGEELHLFNPEAIISLQKAVRSHDEGAYAEFRDLIDAPASPCTLRHLLDFRRIAGTKPLPLDQVESVSEIFKRFCTGAMSFGSISKEAHETIAIAMNRIGGRSNSGEGGEDSHRFVPDRQGDWRRSAIKQIASARFGVTAEYLSNVDEIQIKMAQGAKPGEGGQLPGSKVDVEIAATRHSVPGIDLISPPPHHDIYSIEDLAQLIYDLRCVNPVARISVKLVAEAGIGAIAAGVAKAEADTIIVSGHDGGTGASPLSSLRNAGVPWEIGLAEVNQVLILNDLRSKVRLQADGQLRTGRDVVIAAMLGAEEFTFATVALVSLGCVMLRNCHLNTCEMGIATQNPILRKNFQGTPEHLINYFHFVAEDVRQHLARLGFTSLDEIIGRVDLLEQISSPHDKLNSLNLAKILYKPDMPAHIKTVYQWIPKNTIQDSLDFAILEQVRMAIEEGRPIEVSLEVINTDRAIGAMVSGAIAGRYGGQGLPDDTVRLNFAGSAGQSFGAFACQGMTMILRGEANDYVGKGLSGGQIIISPPKDSMLTPQNNVIAGNTILYGATSGKLFINGIAGERFAVRNSGASAVTEGVGDHCCEYMTGGTVVVLGKIGRNFAAGMSGGTAFVYDEENLLAINCNQEMVDILPLSADEDELRLIGLIKAHLALTNSPLAQEMLAKWPEVRQNFKKIISPVYQAIVEKQREGAGLDGK
jgi:glutamate synthase (NADPH/NADH) large chain